MTEIQRARMLDAMVRAACEKGAANVTVANVTRRAGVSRRTFYEIFDGSRDCLSAAVEEALTRARERVLPAYEAAPDAWRDQIRAGLVALLGFFDEQPEMARLLIVEWLAAGPEGLERRRQVLERIASAVDEGRTLTGIPKGHTPHRGGEAKKSDGPPPLTAEGVVGAVLSILHGRLVRSQSGRLLELTNPLMSTIVLPYGGAAAAGRELERPVPDMSLDGRSSRAPEDVLKDLDMRLTYRTMRVLAAVATHSGGSNRAIADAAGIVDQGQISKLLMRLAKLGLLQNNRTGAATKGEPNAWSLTTKGERLERSLRI
jgi:AcrR family transcriptional regulator/DNA-binding MarR family transcriptional regulator